MNELVDLLRTGHIAQSDRTQVEQRCIGGQPIANQLVDRLRDKRLTAVEWKSGTNLRIVELDIERGLILVAGAVPGTSGGWIYVRDAVKKALPQEAPRPGKYRMANAASGGAAGEAAEAGA